MDTYLWKICGNLPRARLLFEILFWLGNSQESCQQAPNNKEAGRSKKDKKQ
jgi:hypothetical protein